MSSISIPNLRDMRAVEKELPNSLNLRNQSLTSSADAFLPQTHRMNTFDKLYSLMTTQMYWTIFTIFLNN